MANYEKDIINAFLKKYYDRQLKNKIVKINRRIDLNITKIYKDYKKNNADINKKEQVNEIIEKLAKKDFIQVVYLKESIDVEKIVLNENQILQIEKYAKDELDIDPRRYDVEKLNDVLDYYQQAGHLLDYYKNSLKDKANGTTKDLQVSKEEDVLKALAFIEKNDQILYLREASMLIFGSSKYFEEKVKNTVQTILYHYFVYQGEEVDEEENLLERFQIYDLEKDMLIKGPFIVYLKDKVIDVSGLNGGISFSIKDIDEIKKIEAKSSKITTIENKTSFLRMNHQECFIYLGGYANKNQISFLKKLIQDNPSKEYYHFGDIDAGGFLIHKNLCEQTGIEFKLLYMSKNELENHQYTSCLQKLTNNDRTRLLKLKSIACYQECIEYMLEKNIKLEQEIISYINEKPH